MALARQGEEAWLAAAAEVVDFQLVEPQLDPDMHG